MGGRRQSAVLVLLSAFLSAFLSVLFLLSAIAPASAVSLGVNKGTISYDEVLQNGYAEEAILVTTDSEEPILGTYELVGDIAPWLRVEPAEQNFTFSASEPYSLRIIVEPPADARLQNYSGGVRILTGELARSEGGKIGTTTRAAFFIRLALGVTGAERLECRSGGIGIKSTEIGEPFDFVASVYNAGNVRITPDFNVLVYDQEQTTLLENISFEGDAEILPTTSRDFLSRLEHGLPPGQYWATVSVPTCGDGAFLTFDVLDLGGIADKGELLRIDVDSWVRTAEITPVYAVFRNDGGRTVDAKFKGTITTQDGSRIVKTIDTDSYSVPPGGTARIETFFNPSEPGRYVVAGRVLYNGKLTFQKSAIINVEGPAVASAQQYGGIILVVMLAIIVLLLLIIAKKRRRQQRPVPMHRIVRR